MKMDKKYMFFGAALIIRFILIYYAKIVDESSKTKKYTDTDYDVFTDAA